MTQAKTEPPPADREDLLATYHSPLVAALAAAAEEVYGADDPGRRRELRRRFARLIFAPLGVNEVWSRERINALLTDHQMLAALVTPRPTGRRGIVRDDTVTPADDDE